MICKILNYSNAYTTYFIHAAFLDKLDKTAIALARTLQTDQQSKENEGGKTQLEKRRMTVHNIASNLKETKGGQGATLDLEKSFRNRFKSLSKYF